MTAYEITLILSAVTSLTAIIAPIITARISAKSLERQKRIELREPLAYEALNKFIQAYSNLDAATDAYFYIQSQDRFASNCGYHTFVVACHELIPFIPDRKLQNEICEFMSMIWLAGKCTTKEIDEYFDRITIRLGASLAGSPRCIFRRK